MKQDKSIKTLRVTLNRRLIYTIDVGKGAVIGDQLMAIQHDWFATKRQRGRPVVYQDQTPEAIAQRQRDNAAAYYRRNKDAIMQRRRERMAMAKAQRANKKNAK